MTPAPATLTGLAVGDALGLQFETAEASDPKLVAWDGTMGPSEYHKLRKGQWSDDTMMSKLLAESLLAEGTYSPADAAKRYARWLASGDKRGMGKATEKALRRLLSGLTWVQSGEPGAEGNGTAMRAGPLGIFFAYNVEAAAKMASIDAQITHLSREAQCGSSAVATATAILAMGGDRYSFAHKMLEWLPENSLVLGGVESVLKYCEGRVWNKELEWDPDFRKEVLQQLQKIGTKCHVVQTVPAAFLAFMATSSYKDAIETAIRAGGDTDTTAAITGALAGTFYGIEQVRPYLSGLEDAEGLRALEEQLFERAPVVGVT